MRSFKVREGYVTIDGVLYGPTPSEFKVKGVSGGNIHSIRIGTSQFFPQSGVFNDGTIPTVTDNTGIVEPTKKGRTKKVK